MNAGPKTLVAIALASVIMVAAAPVLAQEAGEAAPPGAQPETTRTPDWRGPGMRPGTGPGMGRRMMRDGRQGAAWQDGRGRRMGGMGGHPMMFEMLFAAVDADGSGTLSLQEVLAVHERLFARIDQDDDGELSEREIRRFRGPGRRNR